MTELALLYMSPMDSRRRDFGDQRITMLLSHITCPFPVLRCDIAIESPPHCKLMFYRIYRILLHKPKFFIKLKFIAKTRICIYRRPYRNNPDGKAATKSQPSIIPPRSTALGISVITRFGDHIYVNPLPRRLPKCQVNLSRPFEPPDQWPRINHIAPIWLRPAEPKSNKGAAYIYISGP